MTNKADPIAAAEQAEVKRAEALKARAEKIAADTAELRAEIEAETPRTAVGARAMAEVKATLDGRTGSALDRIRARQAERAARG